MEIAQILPSPRRTTHTIYLLLLVCNMLMGALVLEQGRVIETQRALIKNLFYDAVHIASLHGLAR